MLPKSYGSGLHDGHQPMEVCCNRVSAASPATTSSWLSKTSPDQVGGEREGGEDEAWLKRLHHWVSLDQLNTYEVMSVHMCVSESPPYTRMQMKAKRTVAALDGKLEEHREVELNIGEQLCGYDL